MFDRIAAVLVTVWFVAGLGLLIQSVLLPRPPAADPDAD